MAQVSNIKIKSNAAQFQAAAGRQIANALEAIGGEAEQYAKAECPVDTGRLRNSISHANDETTVYVGTNVEYAPMVEMRSAKHTTGRAHFLRDSVSTHGDEYRAILEAALKS